MLSAASLKRKIYTELKQAGFRFQRTAIIPPALIDKQAIRKVHRPALNHLLAENKRWILENEKALLDFFADGDEVKPREIAPRLILLENPENEYSRLFRYASYL